MISMSLPFKSLFLLAGLAALTGCQTASPSADPHRGDEAQRVQAGLFVSPGEGPVLANYGLDTLRFITPVGIGDTIQARLTCKRKIDQGKTSPQGQAQGVVAWDVEVTNQLGELVASYDILTLVLKR